MSLTPSKLPNAYLHLKSRSVSSSSVEISSHFPGIINESKFEDNEYRALMLDESLRKFKLEQFDEFRGGSI